MLSLRGLWYNVVYSWGCVKFLPVIVLFWRLIASWLVQPSDPSPRHSQPAAALLHNGQLWCGVSHRIPPYTSLPTLSSPTAIYTNQMVLFMHLMDGLSYPERKKLNIESKLQEGIQLQFQEHILAVPSASGLCCMQMKQEDVASQQKPSNQQEKTPAASSQHPLPQILCPCGSWQLLRCQQNLELTTVAPACRN